VGKNPESQIFFLKNLFNCYKFASVLVGNTQNLSDDLFIGRLAVCFAVTLLVISKLNFVQMYCPN